MRMRSDLKTDLLQRGAPAALLDFSSGITLYLLAEDRPFIRKFVLSMVTNLPFEGSLPQRFSLNQVRPSFVMATAHFENPTQELANYLKKILHEIEIGSSSPYRAARILEMKSLAVDDKRSLVQERILEVIRRFPKEFDYDLFSEMQRFFLAFSDQYFRVRSVKEIAQTVMALNKIRKQVWQSVEQRGKERCAFVKVARGQLDVPIGVKQIVGVTIGMNAVGKHELFQESHLLKAIQAVLPRATVVPGSSYLARGGEDPLHLITLGIEKEGGFTASEMRDLKSWLPRTLKGKVERLQRALFMPRNEEEVLKYLITLGQELRFKRDLPQVIISFEKQTETELIFTVIIARLLLPHTSSLEETLFSSSLRSTIDRVRPIGLLRKKYPKEGAVFKVRLSLHHFLRDDQSIDLYKARQDVLNKLSATFGSVRDYNGGMIAKKIEALHRLEKETGATGLTQRPLLEHFFHSLFPIEKSSVIDPKLLKNLFFLLLEQMQGQKDFLTKEEGEYFYFVGEEGVAEKVQRAFPLLINLHLEYDERSYQGFIQTLKIFEP